MIRFDRIRLQSVLGKCSFVPCVNTIMKGFFLRPKRFKAMLRRNSCILAPCFFLSLGYDEKKRRIQIKLVGAFFFYHFEFICISAVGEEAMPKSTKHCHKKKISFTQFLMHTFNCQSLGVFSFFFFSGRITFGSTVFPLISHLFRLLFIWDYKTTAVLEVKNRKKKKLQSRAAENQLSARFLETVYWIEIFFEIRRFGKKSQQKSTQTLKMPSICQYIAP